MLDVTPLSLGIETLGGVMTKLIERNTAIPARKEEIFSTAADNQTNVDIVVLQGEREMSDDNRELDRFSLDGIAPAPRGIPQIRVSFHIDADGMLNVTARDMGTGRQRHVMLTESTLPEKEEIDRMLRDAERHAAADKDRREKVDACNEVESLALQLERLLADLGDSVASKEQARSRQLIDDGRKAVQDELPRTSLERCRALSVDLQQAFHMISSEAYQRAGAARGPQAPAPKLKTGLRGASVKGEDTDDAESENNI